MIAWLIVLLQMRVVDSKTTTNHDLQIANLIGLQRESIGVGENDFLVKRECYIFGLI